MNKLKTISALFIVLMVSVNACFASSLSAPYEFQLLAVNGKKIEKPFFSQAKALGLKEGPQKITVVYNTSVRNDEGNESTMVSSQAFVVTLKVKKNETYWLSSNIKLDSLKKARKFARHPRVKIETKKGKPADFYVSFAKKQDHGRLGDLYYKEDPLTASEMGTTTKSPKSIKSQKSMVDKMLHHWWQQADKETRKKFLAFAKRGI